MAAPAHVIAVGLGPALDSLVRAWFHQFNFLPPIPLTAVQVDTIPAADASFVRLFEMIAASPHSNFILIIHGADDGSGLWLKLVPGQGKPGTSHFDVQRLLDLSAGGAELSPRDQQIMGITAAQSLRVREALLKLQFKTIDTIEFRSCNLGRNPLGLDRFRRFFGARRAGAPNLHTLFGLNPVMFGPYAMEHHQERHPGKNWETYNFPSAYKTPELVCCFQLNELEKPEAGGHIAADSPATLNAWIGQFLMPTGAYRSGEMAVHGLWIADKIFPPAHPGESPRKLPVLIEIDDDQKNSPLGGWGGPGLRRFIPPLSPAYARHIVYAQ
jgi:hypothetical protein